MDEKRSAVQSLDRMFDIMELLCASGNGLPLQEISRTTGLHKSTAHRLLTAMVIRGYVVKEDTGGNYRMTTQLCRLAEEITDGLDLIQRARDVMQRLSIDSAETIHLVVPDESNVVYVHKVEARRGTIRMASNIGSRRPMYCTGVGKAILSLMPSAQVDKIWADTQPTPITPQTIITREGLELALRQARHQGWAIDNEENELGVRCIAAPIQGLKGEILGAISISAPLSRMQDSHLEQLSPLLLRAARRISRDMGWRPAAHVGV